MPRHSWENEDGEAFAAVPHAWEHDSEPSRVGSDSGSDSNSAEELSPGSELVGYCTNLYLQRSLTARDLCTIMHWASEAGVEEAKPLAFRPDAPSGHFQRHLNTSLTALTEHQPSLYETEIPSFDKDEDVLEPRTFWMMPSHEQVAEGFAADAIMRVKLAEVVEERELPSTFWDSPVVTSAPVGSPVLPVSIFVDGVPYSQSDSVIGFWMIDEITKARYLTATLRKAILCGCGCKGWCSFWTVFYVILWSLKCLADGFFPTSRYDGSCWQESDNTRAGKGGQPLGCRAAVIYVKGDWAEYASTLGVP